VTFFPLAAIVRCFVYNNPKVKFIYDSNHTEYFKKIWIISHTQNTIKFHPILFLIEIPHLLVTKKRRSALSSTDYQGQLQIPQSVSVAATQSIWETLRPRYIFICSKYMLDREWFAVSLARKDSAKDPFKLW